MFCPRCRSEYDDSHTECSRCGVLLVEDLPPEDQREYAHFVRLMTASDGIQAEMVKSLLEEHGVHCSVSEYLGETVPGFAATLTVRPLSCPVVVQVVAEEVDEARRLLKTACGLETGESLPVVGRSRKHARRIRRW